MNDYVPLSSFEDLPSPHSPRAEHRDPWYVWGIAASPVLPLAVILALGTWSGWVAGLVMLAGVVVTSLACVQLARLDQRAIAGVGATHRTSALLALVPGAYLLLRAVRRISEPHRGNPLHPVVLNFFTSFALGYYLVLVLMGIVSMVNKGGFS